MLAADEAWALVSGPLENLRADALERPDLPWPERRENLRTELSTATADPMVDHLVTWLDELPDSDRASLLAGDDLPTQAYQVLTDAAAQETAQEAGEQPAAAYDENAWFAYLAEHGARWDGTEESWQAFRDWFLYYAAEAGFGSPATLLLDYLQPMAAADRVTLLGQYGVAIEPPQPAMTTAAAEVAADPRVRAVMAELLAEQPQYADIPEARRLELVAELLKREESKQ